MPWWRSRPSYQPQRTADLPRGREPNAELDSGPELPTLADWPPTPSRHPNWWQVHRVEHHGLERRLVLIAECYSEDEAFKVAAKQASQVRITKWGVKARPYESFRAPLVVVEGTVRTE